MKAINVDKTIENFLITYGEYVGQLIEKYKQTHKVGEKQLREIEESNDLLQKIIKDPKKYLYHDDVIMSVVFDDNGNPGLRQASTVNNESVYDKLGGIRRVWLAYHDDDVLFSLSNYISRHVKESENKGGVWYADNAKSDCWAKHILILNQKLHLLSASNLIQKIVVKVSPISFWAGRRSLRGKRR